MSEKVGKCTKLVYKEKIKIRNVISFFVCIQEQTLDKQKNYNRLLCWSVVGPVTIRVI